MDIYKLIGIIGIVAGAFMLIYAIRKTTEGLHEDTKRIVEEK